MTCLNPVPVYSQQDPPAEISADLSRAVELGRAGDYDQSLEILNGLRQSHPGENRVLFDYLTILSWSGRYQQAADLAKGIEKFSPPDYALAAAAQACRHSGQLKRAEALYQEGQRRFPGQSDFVIGQVMVQTDEQRFTEARRLLTTFKADSGAEAGVTAEAEQYLAEQEKAWAETFEARREAAAKLAREGDYDQALKRLESLKSEKPGHEDLVFDQLTVLSWAGRHDEAAGLADTLDPEKLPDYVLEAAARSYRETGQYDKSEKMYQLGLSRDMNDPRMLAGLQLTKDRRDGVQTEKIRAQSEPEPPAAVEPPADPFQERREEAVRLARSGQYEKALKELEKLQSERPDNQDVLGDRIVISDWAGQHKEAAGLVDELTVKMWEAPEYLASSASSSLRRSGRLNNAKAWYEAALATFPDSLDLNIGYALTLGDLGQSRGGLDYLDAYARKHPLADRTRLTEARNYLRGQTEPRTALASAAPESAAKAAPAARGASAARASAPAGPPARPEPSYRGQQERAVLAARDGRVDEGLAVLAGLHQAHPQDQRLLADYLTLAMWRPDYRLAQDLIPRLDMARAPLYGLESAAEVYISIGNDRQARQYMDRAVRQRGRDVDTLVAAAMVLARCGDYAPAAAYIEEAARKLDSTSDSRLTSAKRAVGPDRVWALADLARANRLLAGAPNQRDHLRLKARALDGVGDGQRPWPPYRAALGLSHGQLDNLEQAMALQEVGPDNIGGPVVTLNTGYQRDLAALAAYDRLLMDPVCAADDVCRIKARTGRLLPLGGLNYNVEMAEEYESLQARGVNFSLPTEFAMADAYLALREPEMAETVYQRIMSRRGQPGFTEDHLYDAQKGLFWTLMDSGQWRRGLEMAECNYEQRRPADGVPPWEAESWTTIDAWRTLGRGYLYTGFLGKGEDLFEELTEHRPYSASALAGLATARFMREQPRAAIDIYRQARELDPKDIGLMIREAEAHLAARNYRQAHAIIQSLEPYQPYSEPVRRLFRAWEVHNMFVLRAGITWTHTDASSDSAYTPGQSPAFQALLYSPPIGYNWRIYAGTAIESGEFREGRARHDMAIGGLEFRNSLAEVNLEIRPSRINRPNYDDGRKHSSDNHTGAGLSGVITPGDHWRIYFSGQHNSRNTPMRAIYNGVNADEYSLGAAYHWNESRFLRVSGSYMDFSDGNDRLAFGAVFNQRLLSAYHHTLDARVNVYTSRNSEDDDRMYFNPKKDFAYGLDLIYSGPIWRRFDRALSHTLSGGVGQYHQKHFGSGPTWRVDYQHNLDWTDQFALNYGAGYGRKVYDGDPEKNLDLYLNVIWKF